VLIVRKAAAEPPEPKVIPQPRCKFNAHICRLQAFFHLELHKELTFPLCITCGEVRLTIAMNLRRSAMIEVLIGADATTALFASVPH